MSPCAILRGTKKQMRVGLGKHFKPSPVLTRQTQAIFESVPTSAEEAASHNRDELWNQISFIMKEEKRLVSPPHCGIRVISLSFVVIGAAEG